MNWFALLPLPFLAALGCAPTPGARVDDGTAGDDDATAGDDDDATAACAYPDGAQDEMALGAVLSPYSWPTSSAPDGSTPPVSVQEMYCDDAAEHWSPFDVLLFVSIPAW